MNRPSLGANCKTQQSTADARTRGACRELSPHLSHASITRTFPSVPFPFGAGAEGKDEGGGGGGLDWLAEATSEKPKPSLAGLAGHHEGRTESDPPVDLLSAALSGNTELVEGTAAPARPSRGQSDSRATERSSGGSSSSIVKQRGAKPKTAVPPAGSWITGGSTIGISPVDNDSDREDGGNVAGGDGSRVDVGVQWEEGAGDTVGAQSSPSKSSLPPWAKPYARPTRSVKKAVRDGEGSSNETAEPVMEVVSSGIQCGESVLGG